jgi:YggT family protein
MGDFLAFVVQIVSQILLWAIIIRVLLSWLPMANIRVDPYNPAVRLLYSITDPILEPLRKYTTVGMVDLSPLVAIIILQLVAGFLVDLLQGL